MKLDATFAPWLQYLKAYLKALGLGMTVTSTNRSREKQAQLEANPQGYPVAAPGTSQHEFGFAFDAVVKPRQYQAAVGQLWRSWGLWWDSTDEVHFAAFDPGTWSKFLATLPSTGLSLAGGYPGVGLFSGFGGVSGSGQQPGGPVVSTSIVATSTARPQAPLRQPTLGSSPTIALPSSTSTVSLPPPPPPPAVSSSSVVPFSTSRH